MQRSPIEWTHFTSNPLRYRDKDGNVVHACVHASTGCLKCYSEALAPRYGHAGKPFTAPNMANLTPFLDEKELHSILTYKPAAGHMCFLGDMTDIFGEWVSDELLDQLFANLILRPDITFQILTKRADRMMAYFSSPDRQERIISMAGEAFDDEMECRVANAINDQLGEKFNVGWPMRNIWLGVSVENQDWANERIPLLLATPASKRFVSYEPALGPVDFARLPIPPYLLSQIGVCGAGKLKRRIDQIIVGGESGSGARPFEIAWARSVVQQCKAAGVACFYKQGGSSNKWELYT